jgi:hypothetical protein
MLAIPEMMDFLWAASNAQALTTIAKSVSSAALSAAPLVTGVSS